MAKKNIFHDIIPPEKRSIRNLTIPKHPSSEKPEQNESKKESEGKTQSVSVRKTAARAEPRVEPELLARKWGEEPRASRKIWIIALLSVAALVLCIVFLVSKATVTVSIKKFDITLDNDITAAKAGNGLLYSSISLSDTESLEVPATTTKQVLSTAAGTVVIYNNQASEQKLIATTRLATASGLIFRLDSAITVPARTTSGGKTVPGSMAVKVHADKPGASYNVGLTDFTLPAFAGDPRAQNVYGRSKTAIGGGQTGTVPVLSASEASTTRAAIESTLSKKILTEARAQVPADFVLFDDGGTITFTDMPSDTKDGKAVVEEKATFKGYIFKKSNFATYFASLQDMTVASNTPVLIEAPNLVISGVNETGDTLKLHMKGDIHVSYVLDTEALKKDLEGKNKNSALKVFENYAAIETAKINVAPLWWVPKNPDRIEVITK